MKARLKYNEIEGAAGYEVQILGDAGWETDTFYALTAGKGRDTEDYVYYGLLVKLSEMQRLGYEIDLQF